MKYVKRIKTRNINKYGIDKAIDPLEHAQRKHPGLKNKFLNSLAILLPFC